MDPNQQWEVRKITGRKMVGREMHYQVEWKDTWMPESDLAEAKELVVDAFMAQGGSGSGSGSGSGVEVFKTSTRLTPIISGVEPRRSRRTRRAGGKVDRALASTSAK
jgi:hypothetical protein